jgi:hypothetical protein
VYGLTLAHAETDGAPIVAMLSAKRCLYSRWRRASSVSTSNQHEKMLQALAPMPFWPPTVLASCRAAAAAEEEVEAVSP